jgi:hypothetical protein
MNSRRRVALAGDSVSHGSPIEQLPEPDGPIRRRVIRADSSRERGTDDQQEPVVRPADGRCLGAGGRLFYVIIRLGARRNEKTHPGEHQRNRQRRRDELDGCRSHQLILMYLGS